MIEAGLHGADPALLLSSTTLSGVQKRNATVCCRIGTCIDVLPLKAELPDWEIDLRKPPIEPEEKKQKTSNNIKCPVRSSESVTFDSALGY